MRRSRSAAATQGASFAPPAATCLQVSERVCRDPVDADLEVDVIGYVGCTGSCFGDHVHFEIRINGVATDPLGYL